MTQRMSLDNVKKGKILQPYRLVVYGHAGTGKTSFAADAPNAIGICSEEGTAQIDCARFPEPRTLAEATSAVVTLCNEEHKYETLFLDTLDWFEPLVFAHVCAQGGKTNIEDFGYGKGHEFAVGAWRVFLQTLNALIRPGAKRPPMNVILVAHGEVQKVDDPITGSFERYRPKLHKKASALVCEWADAVLFARHEAYTQKDKDTKKTRGVSTGERVLHTRWSAAFEAKNRYGLDEKIPLSWDAFNEMARRNDDQVVPSLIKQIEAMRPQLPAEKQAKLPEAIRACKGDAATLAKFLNRVRAEVTAYEERRAAEGTAPSPEVDNALTTSAPGELGATPSDVASNLSEQISALD